MIFSAAGGPLAQPSWIMHVRCCVLSAGCLTAVPVVHVAVAPVRHGWSGGRRAFICRVLASIRLLIRRVSCVFSRIRRVSLHIDICVFLRILAYFSAYSSAYSRVFSRIHPRIPCTFAAHSRVFAAYSPHVLAYSPRIRVWIRLYQSLCRWSLLVSPEAAKVFIVVTCVLRMGHSPFRRTPAFTSVFMSVFMSGFFGFSRGREGVVLSVFAGGGCS